MKISEEEPGVFVAVLEVPLTPAEVSELTKMVPADSYCVDAEGDGDLLYMTWERPGR